VGANRKYHPVKWIALTWQGGLTQVCQSLGTKYLYISAMEEIAPAVFTAVLCIALWIVFLLFS
jgi:hypothetical protein